MNDIMIDCRWLGYSGVGRVLCGLLDGLRTLSPSGTWKLWGPEAVEELAWPGATVQRTDHSPLALVGQRGMLEVPPAALSLFPHLVRPLAVRGRSAVIAHDTIPVRHSPTRLRRAGMRTIYTASVHSAWRVLVYSDATARRLRSDLGLRERAMRRVELPWNVALVEEIRRRRVRPRQDELLYVGLDRPQKNLDRALAAFAASAFAAEGGRFRLVGLKDGGAERVRALAASLRVHDRVVAEAVVAEDALVDAFAAATVLILPSLEEGLGLPVIEALASGVPVACSRCGGPEEAARGYATLFDPWSVPSITAAIDEATSAAVSGRSVVATSEFAARVPVVTPAAFAAAVLGALELSF